MSCTPTALTAAMRAPLSRRAPVSCASGSAMSGSPRHRGLVSGAVAVLVLGALASPAHAGDAVTNTLDAEEWTPTALVVLAPGSTDPGLEARLIAAARNVPSSLAIVPASALGVTSAAVARCPPAQLIGCLMGMLEGRRGEVRVLIVASVLPSGERDAALRALVIDVERTRAVFTAPSATGDGDTEREDRAYRQLYEGPVRSIDPRDASAIAAYFGELMPQLASTIPGAQRLGTIVVEAPSVITAVSLDDRPLGAIAVGSATITHVRPGARVVHVTTTDGRAADYSVDVLDGRTATLVLPADLTGAAPPPAEWAGWWRGLTWTGVGLGGAGVAMLAIGALSGGDVQQLCLLRPGANDSNCSALGAPSFGFDGALTPSADAARINPPGVGPLALGSSIAATGAVWAVGALLWEDESRPPWWVIASGVVAGVLTYALVTGVSP